MTQNETNIRSIERAINILRYFKQDKPELTLTEISKGVNLPVSTVARIITTLKKHRFLARNKENQKYYLGAEIARLGTLCYSNLDFRRIALPFMIELRDLFNESVSLFIAEGDQRVCIERVESTHSLRRVINIGSQLPLSRGASGRLLLAYMDKNTISEILSKDPYTTLESLEKLKKIGHSISKGEREKGVVSVAVPVFDIKNQILAVLSISGPTERFSEERINFMLEKLKHYSKLISKALGNES